MKLYVLTCININCGTVYLMIFGNLELVSGGWQNVVVEDAAQILQHVIFCC